MAHLAPTLGQRADLYSKASRVAELAAQFTPSGMPDTQAELEEESLAPEEAQACLARLVWSDIN